MSRSCYSDDFGDDFAGQIGLYRGNVDRSIRSKAGQARLVELRDALLAMPDKRLVSDLFAPATGEACALGVWAKRHIPDADAVQDFEGDDNDTAELLKPFKWPRLVVMDLVYQNDQQEYVYEDHLGPHQHGWDYRHPDEWPLRRARPETDEERYTRVLAWVNDNIVAETKRTEPAEPAHE